jgi:dTDP-3-amino-3,4,6-trideoxy-alpha-D-glucose transaminase
VNVPFLDVRAAQAELRDELQAAYARVAGSGEYVLGHELEAFEREFAASCGTAHAVGVGNGLDALTLVLRAGGVGPGDEVIVPAHTFIATWLAVVQCGARVVPVDIEPARMLMDIDAAAAACTRRTAALIPVHLYGCPIEPSGFAELAERFGLMLVGDAAQAHGASIAGQSVAVAGDAATFSFYPSKNLGALGDGGAVTTHDDELAHRLRRLRNYGSETKYEFLERGVNSRLDPLQAAFLRVKLEALPEWNARRARIAERYLEELADLPALRLPAPPPTGGSHAWHIFCVRHPSRETLKDHLARDGIQTQVHYPLPPHLTPAFADLELERGAFPVTEAVAACALSLPIGPHLGDDAVTRVIESVRSFAT